MRQCPRCKSTYPPETYDCWRCRRANARQLLVPAPPEQPKPKKRRAEIVVNPVDIEPVVVNPIE